MSVERPYALFFVKCCAYIEQVPRYKVVVSQYCVYLFAGMSCCVCVCVNCVNVCNGVG